MKKYYVVRGMEIHVWNRSQDGHQYFSTFAAAKRCMVKNCKWNIAEAKRNLRIALRMKEIR